MQYIIYIKVHKQLKKKIEGYRKKNSEHIKKLPFLPPHCSMIVTNLDENRESGIISSLEDIARMQKPFILRCNQLEMFDNEAFVTSLYKSPEVDDFHNKIIRTLSEYVKQDELRPLLPRYDKDPDRVETYKKYGSPYVERFYRPHITLWHVDPSHFNTKDFNISEFEGKHCLAEAAMLAVKETKESEWKTINQLKFGN